MATKLPSGKASATLTIQIDPSAVTFTAAPPELVSQRTVLHAVGIPPRVFLELVRAPGFPLDVVRVGKLRLVDRAAFVAWLRARAAAPVDAPANDADHGEDDQDAAVDAVLAELNLERKVPRTARGRR